MDTPDSQSKALLLGVPKYKTGKPCKHGHVGERWTLTGGCCQCIVERVNKRREAFRQARRENEREAF
jgi:hypothetical protein